MERRTAIRISSKGQIVLPKRLRDEFGWQAGDYLIVHGLDDGTLVLEREPQTKFDAIVAEFQREAKRQGLTRKDLEEAVKEARKERLRREGR